MESDHKQVAMRGERVMATIPLKLASKGKRGLVRVTDEKGNILRDVLVDKAELDRVNASARDWPSCVTQAEWESGRVVLMGFDQEPGDVLIDGDVAVVQTGERFVGNELVREFVKMEKGEWSATTKDLILSDTALSAVGVDVTALTVSAEVI